MNPIEHLRVHFGDLRRTLGAIPPSVRILAIGVFINSAGTALVWPLTTIYVNQVLGKSLTVAGFVSLLQSGSNLIGQVVGGHLFDRLGGKRVLIGGLWASAAIVTAIGIYQTWTVYAPAVVLLGFSTAFFWGPLNAYITELWPEGGRYAFNFLYVVRNLGMAIGASLGGLVAGISFRLVFFINAGTLLVYSAILASGVHGTPIPIERVRTSLPSGETPPPTHQHQSRRGILLTALSFGNFLAWTAYSQWATTVSIYMKTHGYSLAQYGLLWTANGIFIFALQPILAVLVRRVARRLGTQMTMGAVLYVCAFALVMAARAYSWYVLAMAVMTLGEILIAPALPAAVAELAPPGRRGFYQGLLESMASGGRMVGPLAGGFIYDRWGPPVLWPAVMGIAGLSGAAYGAYAQVHSTWARRAQVFGDVGTPCSFLVAKPRKRARRAHNMPYTGIF